MSNDRQIADALRKALRESQGQVAELEQERDNALLQVCDVVFNMDGDCLCSRLFEVCDTTNDRGCVGYDARQMAKKASPKIRKLAGLNR